MKKAKYLTKEKGLHICGILTDKAITEKKGKPVLEFKERSYLAKAIMYNDKVVVQETYSPIKNLIKYNPDILLESSDHSNKYLKELKEQIKKHNLKTKIIIDKYQNGISSTKIKNKCKKLIKGN
jgi:glycerol-3-phosphate cytidylyltransferase-like family protein